MSDNFKKLLITAGLVGASAYATYAAIQLLKSITELDSTIVAIDYDDLRKESRHFSEMVDSMKSGIVG